AGVDEHRARLHFHKALLVDEVVRSGHQGTVQRDDVALADELVEVDIPPDLAHLRVMMRIVQKKLHSKAVQDAGDALADHARSHDAGGAAMKIEAEEPVERKIPLSHL